MNTANSWTTQGKIEKLLLNGLLFCGLRCNDSIFDKLRNLENNLSKGADVNATDANDSNNTPLHIAVEKNEPEIVKFLLRWGANVHTTNKNKHTPLNLATLSNHIEIISILQTSMVANEDKEFNKTKLTKKEFSKIPSQISKSDNNKETVLSYKNRPGTAGIRGQFYETKLLGLLLHRAINDHDIDEFYLGSNVEGLGAFDDIVFKYYLKNESIPKICFIQAKHRDNPKKDKLTVSSVLNPNSDFSLHKYFESYLKVTKKFTDKTCQDGMFKNGKHYIDRNFIIYTSAAEQFKKKNLIRVYGKETLILTGENGKTFGFDYDNEDVDALLNIISKARAKSLAKAFATNIASDKYEKMMWDESIKVYHVFLANNIVQICYGDSKDYLIGSFRKSFLDSKNEIFVLIKETMTKEFKSLGEQSMNTDFCFKLPNKFGNFMVSLNAGEFDSLFKIIDNLTELKGKSDKRNTITIDDEMVSTSNILTERNTAVLKKLVGETLILDDEIDFFKFNTKTSFSEVTKVVLERLKLNIADENYINSLRLDIAVQDFPQLTLCKKRYLTDFLNNLQFYTDQEDEEGVENIIKHEINNRYITENVKHDSLYHIKADALYLQYHDRVQRWWKNPKEYLTKTCEFYKESKKVINDSPLINIYSYVYTKKINDYEIYFDENAINFLKLQEFMSTSNAKVLHITTKDKTWTSIKVIQYFKNIQELRNCKFIDYDVVADEGFKEVILSEISETLTDYVIIIMNDACKLTNLVIPKIKKLIVISHSGSLTQIHGVNFTCVERLDQDNCFRDLDTETKHRISKQKNILFQGLNIPLASILDEEIEHFVNEMVLHKVLNINTIKIGKEPTNFAKYYTNIYFHVDRYLCQCLHLNENKMRKKENLNVFHVVEPSKSTTKEINDNKDVLIISNDDTAFKEASNELQSVNVHWFRRKNGNIYWEKSYGNIQNIIPYIQKILCKEDCCCLFEPKSLKDLNNRTVILSGEPGMGKSTFLTHVMMQTKQFDKSMCVLKLNLLDLTNEFSKWQECDASMRLRWILTVLYKAFSVYKTDFINLENNTINDKNDDLLKNILIGVNNKMYLNDKVNATIKICEITVFEFRIFLNMYNKGKISVLLDGYDEICPDYKRQAIELFKELIKSRVQHLWITSRSYVILNELEFELNTFAYTLKSFSSNDQIIYLEKIWGRTEQLENINFYVKLFLNAISLKMNNYEKDFMGTPLHLQMIAETYQEYFFRFYTSHFKFQDTFNLTTLYEKFVEIKFYKIRFGEKRNCLCYKDPDIKMVIELGRSVSIENHKKLAAYALLDRKNDAGILTEDDLKHVLNLIQRFSLGEEKTGIIETIYKNVPKFVHFTYAEYFACEFICDKLKHNNELICKYMVRSFLVMDYTGTRRFFESKLENDETLFQFSSKYICDTLLEQSEHHMNALEYALMENHYNIILFLLKNLDAYLTKDNLDNFMCLVSEDSMILEYMDVFNNNRDKSLLLFTNIIKIILRFDCTKLVKLFFKGDIPISSVFMLVFVYMDQFSGENRDIIDTMIEHMQSEDLTKLLTTLFGGDCILHLLLMSHIKTNMYMLKYFEKLNPTQRMMVFSTRDIEGRVPAHFAAINKNFKFFEKMACLVEKEQFKAICSICDEYNKTALQYLSYSGELSQIETDMFRSLCATVGIDDVYLVVQALGRTDLN